MISFYTLALLLLHRPPCWNKHGAERTTARHVVLVVSLHKWNLGYSALQKRQSQLTLDERLSAPRHLRAVTEGLMQPPEQAYGTHLFWLLAVSVKRIFFIIRHFNSFLLLITNKVCWQNARSHLKIQEKLENGRQCDMRAQWFTTGVADL